MKILNKKTTKPILLLLKLAVIIAIACFIYFKLKDEQNINEYFIKALNIAFYQHWPILLLVIVLMPINWVLEAYKWMMLAKPIQKLDLLNAFKGVLAGLSIGFITPHGLGAYLGRVLMIKTETRTKLIGAVLLGRIMQLLATLIFGTLGVYYLFGVTILTFYMLLLVGLISSGLILLQFKIKVKNKLLEKLGYYVGVMNQYSVLQLVNILGVACLRYIIFSCQFVLVLYMFTDLAFMLNFAGTTWILLAKSVIPTFNFLSDLGIREFSAIFFFEQFNVPLIPIVSASMLVWIINILVPTIIGAPLVLKLKIKV